MYLFFDTETAGLPANYKAPVTDSKNWPRLVQIAWHVVRPDGLFEPLVTRIIKPDGFTIPEGASKIHGITTEKAMSEGQELHVVMREFLRDVERAACLVGHNIDFDMNIVGAELHRLNVPHSMLSKKQICTMKASTDYCKLPGNYGYKWPSLTQLHQTLFESEFDDAHDAGGNVLACMKCFYRLQSLGVI